MNSTTVFLAVFFVFLLFLAILDIFMVVSLIAPGDERKRMIVLQAAADTLLITVLSLIIDIIESLASFAYKIFCLPIVRARCVSVRFRPIPMQSAISFSRPITF